MVSRERLDLRAALDIGIVGAGTAGNAAAIILQRDGHRVTLYERAPTPGPVGAGLMMQPSGMAVLSLLGLDQPIRESGARIERLRCVTRGGRDVFTLTYGDLSPELHGIGLHRGVLFSTLFDAARASGAKLVTGITIASLANAGRRKVLVADDGTRHGPHDLVVMASGSRSLVSDDEAPVRRALPYPWGALWFVAETDTVAPELFQVLHGTRRMLGILPVAKDLVTVFWSVPVATHEAARETMEQDIIAHHPAAAKYFTPGRNVLFSTYTDVRMPRWDNGPVVYVGDCGHGMSPQLGQGANLALVDAHTLGETLRATADLPSALAAYSARRRGMLHYYQFVTRWLTPFFQSDATWLGPMRDYLMNPLTRIPPVRRLMLQSMAGFRDRQVRCLRRQTTARGLLPSASWRRFQSRVNDQFSSASSHKNEQLVLRSRVALRQHLVAHAKLLASILAQDLEVAGQAEVDRLGDALAR